MIIEKLELKNFKSHLNTSIDFNQGITLIIGENGAGKSTILEAISFALFKQHTAGTISDLTRSSTDNTIVNTMKVTLEFMANGNHYKVVRSKDKTKSQATLYYRHLNSDKTDYVNNIICEGDKIVNSEIQSILQMDADLFLNAIYVRQGEIAELVSKTPSEKKKLIGKLLGIDSLEKSWNNIKQFISFYENKQSEYKGKLSRKEDTANELKQKKKQYDDLNTEITKIQEELNQINKIYDELNTEIKVLEANKEEYVNTKNIIDGDIKEEDRLKQEKTELQNQLDEIRKNEEEIQRLEKYVNKLPVFKEYKEAAISLLEITKKKDDLNKQKENFTIQNNIITENEQIYKDYIRLETIINDLKEDKSNIESELKIYEKISKDKNKLLEEFTGENDKFTKFKEDLLKKLSEDGIGDVDGEDFVLINKALSLTISNMESRIIEIDDEILNKKDINSKSLQIIAQSEKPLEELESVGDKCPICQSNISNQKKLDLKKSYKDAILDSKNTIDQNKEDIKKLEAEKKEIKDKINKLAAIEKELD